MEDNREGIEIDLQKLLMVYLRRWWVILLCGIVVAGFAFVYTAKFVTPLYRASVTIYVNNYGVKMTEDVEYVTGSNLTAAQQLVATYINIISSDTVLEDVVEQSNLNLTVKEIRGMMSASQVGETEMFTVSISHPDPTVAAQVANAIADVAPKKITEFVEGSSTKIIDYAKVPTAPYTPSYKKNVAIGFLIGVVAAAGVLTVLYLMDVRIKDASDLESNFDLPVLGQIPDFTQRDTGKRGSRKYGYTQKGYGGYGGGYGYYGSSPQSETEELESRTADAGAKRNKEEVLK